METEPNNNVKAALKARLKGPKASSPVPSTVTLEIQTYEAPPGAEKQHLIKVEDLERYIMAMVGTGGFRKQFQILRSGHQKPLEAGKASYNKAKNRYADLLPYDENRVVLQKLKTDPYSDYINASYIDGYNKPKAYICTQGPLEKTVADFWRMVWQEEVCKIVMTANIIEDGKKKCEKYWPDSTAKYGDIVVSPMGEEVFVDYTVRTFKLYKSGISCSRYVRQYQHTDWPDHGVPVYPLSVVRMLQEIHAYQPHSKAPLLMHCSAGVGRSGALMLLDMALQMLKKEGRVDVVGLMYKMRQQRISLVENVDQYVFVYKTLIDVHFGDVTNKQNLEVVLYFNRLRLVEHGSKKTGLANQFERLGKLTPPLPENRCTVAMAKENRSKNRTLEILPPDNGRPVLQASPPSNYINAVYVNGFGRQNAFIVTQYPLPSTVSDFWRLVNDTGSASQVLLNPLDGKDETCPVFWPEFGSAHHGNFKIDHITSEMRDGIVTRKLKFRDVTQSQKARTIKQFQLPNWSKDHHAPPSLDVILNLISKVHRSQQKTGNKPVIVMCYNGCTGSGFYCAADFLVRQMRERQEVDIFLAVRTVRVNRPSFIPLVDQYRWLYEIGCALVSYKKITKSK